MTPERYVPLESTRPGFAFSYVTKPQAEDKPTVEIDMFAPGMRQALYEAVSLALECWEPVFDHWEEVKPKRLPSGALVPCRKKPVFKGRHADKLGQFHDRFNGYMRRNHPDSWNDQIFLEIAAKYVHLRPHEPNQKRMREPNTPYVREMIRPVIRRSDPEWNPKLVQAAREEVPEKGEARYWEYLGGLTGRYPQYRVHTHVGDMLRAYDSNHQTMHHFSYEAEVRDLCTDNAPLWEHLRLVAHYVQDIVDSRYLRSTEGLPQDRARRRQPRTTARHS
jgi:hypothetical protein